jgi:hypothetical protein
VVSQVPQIQSFSDASSLKSAPRSNLFSLFGTELSKINWKRIAFWTALWFFIHSAPTEDPFARFRPERDVRAAVHFENEF